MIDAPYVYPFASEVHLRRGRTVLRPVVRLALADPALVLNALVDTGSEHVLADSSIAVAAGLDLTDPIDVEEIGFGGGVVEARFAEVTGFLHTPRDSQVQPVSWTLEVGFVDDWRPVYPCILGSIGFLDQFTVTISRFAQATAVERREAFDDRFSSPLA